MKVLQIAMVDDMAHDRKWLAVKLKNYLHTNHIPYILHSFSSGEEFVSALQEHWFDIVFMDIYMDGMTGIEAASALRTKDRDCRLIFLTTSEDFMRQGFSLNSAHYLVKPVKDEDFRQAMENCRIKRNCQVPYIDLTSARQNIHLDTMDILYIDAQGRNAVVHTRDSILTANKGFRATTEPLQTDERFLLCNRGLLVNMDFITALELNDFVLVNGERLPIAYRRRTELISRYRSYTFGTLGDQG